MFTLSMQIKSARGLASPGVIVRNVEKDRSKKTELNKYLPRCVHAAKQKEIKIVAHEITIVQL
jgi:hypothetical protein